MPDLNSYLAAHYLTAEPKPSKKRKRKAPKSEASGLLIADDDEPGWTKPGGSDDDDDELQTAVAGTSAEFRRAKKSAWKTVGDGGGSARNMKKEDEEDASAADAVLASAAAESAAAAGREAADEAPAVADGDARMSDGTFAGLQSAKAISAQLARRREEEMAELEAMEREKKARRRRRKKDDDEDEAEEDQVVLRDATGRRVDVSMARAEARRAAAEAEEKARRDEEARKRALKGDVQLEEARRRKEALEDAALMPLARGKDDEELNAEMKAARRWNDPMAQFLGDDEPRPAAGGKAKAGGKSNSRRPVYKGAAPPNRYGIRPGYRWDGVDRGNGFEAERFKALNRRERNKGLEYAWQMDE